MNFNKFNKNIEKPQNFTYKKHSEVKCEKSECVCVYSVV